MSERGSVGDFDNVVGDDDFDMEMSSGTTTSTWKCRGGRRLRHGNVVGDDDFDMEMSSGTTTWKCRGGRRLRHGNVVGGRCCRGASSSVGRGWRQRELAPRQRVVNTDSWRSCLHWRDEVEPRTECWTRRGSSVGRGRWRPVEEVGLLAVAKEGNTVFHQIDNIVVLLTGVLEVLYSPQWFDKTDLQFLGIICSNYQTSSAEIFKNGLYCDR